MAATPHEAILNLAVFANLANALILGSLVGWRIAKPQCSKSRQALWGLIMVIVAMGNAAILATHEDGTSTVVGLYGLVVWAPLGVALIAAWLGEDRAPK
jgi:hypothetical protein